MATTNVTLLERADALRIVEEWIHEHADEVLLNGGALPDELAALLDLSEGDFDGKMERTALKRRDLQAYAARCKAEKDYYAQREKMWGNADEALRRYQHRALERAGRDKVKTALVTVWVQASPPAVKHAYDEDLLLKIADQSEADEAAAVEVADKLDEPEPPHPLARFISVKRVASLDSRAVLEAWKARRAELELQAEAEITLTDDERSGIRFDLELAVAEHEAAVSSTEFEAGVREALAEALTAKRAAWVDARLAEAFPGITVEQGTHVRQR